MSRHVKYILLGLLVALLVGCGPTPSQPAAEPTAQEPLSPTQEPPSPAQLTDVPAPTSVPTQEPTAPPADTPQGWIGPDAYPDDVNPLTGLQVADPAVLDRRPLAIKVSNSVRPPVGIEQADLVYEHLTEGQITRFTAIFYTNTPDLVGSVRSARLIDLEIIPMYQVFLACSGWSTGVGQNMHAAGYTDRLMTQELPPPLFERKPINVQPVDNLFVQPAVLWDEAGRRGINQRPDLTPGMVFSETAPEGGMPASRIRLRYGAVMPEWRYIAETGLWARWQDGSPHVERFSNQTLSAANVVVIYAEHRPDPEIGEDSLGSPSLWIDIYGETRDQPGQGDAFIFRDGRQFEARWVRPGPDKMLVFTDADGNPLPLKPGVTWIEVVPLDFEKLNVEP
jgi:hypothetical protein